jgi:hypothetical protein
MTIQEFLPKYILGWNCYCLFAAGLIVLYRKRLAEEIPLYLSFLFVKWKLLIFLPACLFVTFTGPFTDDETWDMISGGGMSVLTFLTAPWAIGTIYKVRRFERPVAYGFIAVALWLFSSSWFYDGYLLLRDGSYTNRWIGNLILSPQIYLCAGLLWNLETNAEGKIRLGHTRKDWPAPPPPQDNSSLLPILWAAIPLILIAAYILVAFVGWHF